MAKFELLMSYARSNQRSRAAARALAAVCAVAVAGSPTLTSAQNAATIQSGAGQPSAGKSGGGQVGASTRTAARTQPDLSRPTQSIIALVNDEPITGYEISQRATMMSGGSIQEKARANFQAIIKNPKTSARLKAILEETIKANEGKSKDQIIAIFEKRKKDFAVGLQKQAVESARESAAPGVRQKALEDIIDERLKLQEAKRLNVVVADEDVMRAINNMIERNKMTEEQFKQQLGGSLDPMKSRIRTTLSWNEVVRRRFGAQIAITSRDVDKFVASSTAASEDGIELQVQRIRIALPAKIDQAAMAQRMQDAEKIRAKFTDCKSAGSIANGVPGAKFEETVRRRPSSIPEPTRTLLLNASPGEMLPPSVGDGTIELWAVCGREVFKAADEQRVAAEGELKQKEFEVMSRRHLKDLRQDAHIEYR